MQGWLTSVQEDLGITTVYVTHDQTEACALCDNVTVLNDGRISQQGPPRELRWSMAAQDGDSMVSVTSSVNPKSESKERDAGSAAKPTFRPVHGRLREDIVRQIEQLMVSGDLRTCDRLPTKRDMSEQFGPAAPPCARRLPPSRRSAGGPRLRRRALRGRARGAQPGRLGGS